MNCVHCHRFEITAVRFQGFSACLILDSTRARRPCHEERRMRQTPAVLAVWMFWIALPCARGVTQAAGAKTPANVAVELSFTAARPHPDPFNHVTLDVLVTEPGGRTLRVPAFWDGKEVWKARYASAVVGTHAFRTECSDTSD